MGIYLQKKRDNLDLIIRTVETAGSAIEDGSFLGKPVLLWLESTSRCNLRCLKCGHAYDPPGTTRTLPRNLSDAVVDGADDYFAAAVKVRTSGYGEMFLFSRLRSLVERIKRYECWTEGTTNGVAIDHSEVDWLVDLEYDQLVFSIDGAEPETMRRLRGADLNKIWDVLRYIQQRKEQTGSVKPQIVVGFVAQSDNLHELPCLVRELSTLNICFLAVNTLHYKKYVPGADDSYGKLHHDYSLANLEQRRVTELLTEARTLAYDANIGLEIYFDPDRIYRESAPNWDSRPDDEGELIAIDGTSLDAVTPRHSDAQTRVSVPASAALTSPNPTADLKPYYCVYPWTSLFVTARGSTAVCCSMQGDIGTVLDSGDLDRVWNGATLRSIRQSIARGEVHSNCAYCVSRDRHLSSFVDLESVKSALALMEKPNVEVGLAAAEIPAESLFGCIDTSAVKARSLEQVRIAGWSASGRHGAPVREVKLRLDGHELSTVRTFHARPDVAAYYGRKDLLRSGWQKVVHLPALAPGEYQLSAEATDPEGVSGVIGAVLLSIIG